MGTNPLKKFAKRVVKDYAFNRMLPKEYLEAAKAPINPKKAVFVELEGRLLSDNYRLLWDKLERDYGFTCELVCLQRTAGHFGNYLAHAKELARTAATARLIFLNDACDVVSCFPLRPETKVAQVWHACGAFKKWGMSTAKLKFGGTADELLRHPYYANLSLVTVSSPDVRWAYAEAMILEDKMDTIKPLGTSRTDKFFDSEFLGQARAKVEAAVPQAQGKRIVLYAPTFRGHVDRAKGPDELDLEAMRAALGQDHVVLVKHHPFVKNRPAIPATCAEFAFDISEALAIDELLVAADVCISDYSSLVFEYSLFERPMAFFAYDLEDYGDWRGFYYPYEELAPGPVLTTTQQVIDFVLEVRDVFDPTEVVAFREKFMAACDGHATERILEDLLPEETAALKKRGEEPATPDAGK